jgi:hypothetical protein
MKLPSPTTYDIPDHPLAQIFPMMENQDREEIQRSIREHGIRDPIVILDEQVLDGRNRLAACKATGQPARFRLFDPETDGDPLAFVMDANLARRHLTTSQRAAVAADLMERMRPEPQDAPEQEPATEEATGEGHVDTSGEFSQETPGDEPQASNGAKPKAPKKPKAAKPAGKAREKAAKLMNVSPRSVQKAATLKKQDPKKFAEVKAGATGLNKAATDASKKDKERQAYEGALARIKNIAGKSLYSAIIEGTRLKRKADVIAYAALSDEDMLSTRHLIEEGWKVQDAAKYKARNLSRTHSIQDLLNRAAHAGGFYNLEIQGYDISVKKRRV